MKTILAADLFCGAGGTSTGLFQAAESIGVRVDLTAINHWDIAVATHSANYPGARHLCETLDAVNPRTLYPSGRINLLVASPECTHHSIARGGVPRCDQSRSSAWHIVRWAEALYIDNILIENVPEFQTWGPLGVNGLPLKSKRGATFQAFCTALTSLGYRVDYRVLNAADYGDPTTRKRFFLIARRGNKKIQWPEPTHTQQGGRDLFGKTMPWVPAREIIDWSLSGESIFNRRRPLAEKTLARIEYGLNKFGGREFLVKFFGTSRVADVDRPAPAVTAGGLHLGVCQPFLARFHGGAGGEKRVHGTDKPLPVVDTSNRYGLIEPFLLPQQQGAPGQMRVRSIDMPVPTLTTTGAEQLVQPFLIKYFGTGKAQSIDRPLGTVTTRDRFGLIEVFEKHPALDIRMRMLQPHELAAAQGFPVGYKFAGNKGQVVKQIGNAVPRRTARALCRELIR
jgi:DNA (cytosine-5)-methyltransferase 1